MFFDAFGGGAGLGSSNRKADQAGLDAFDTAQESLYINQHAITFRNITGQDDSVLFAPDAQRGAGTGNANAAAG